MTPDITKFSTVIAGLTYKQRLTPKELDPIEVTAMETASGTAQLLHSQSHQHLDSLQRLKGVALETPPRGKTSSISLGNGEAGGEEN